MSRPRITLPPPHTNGPVPLETAIARRRSVRRYAEKQLTVEQIGQLLWAAHTTASVHESVDTDQPTWLVLYTCRADGVWKYRPQEHCLTRHLDRDARGELANAAHHQKFIAQAPCVFVMSAIFERGAERYGERWRPRYLPIEAGRVAESLLLQAVALGLASVPVGEFDDARIRHVLALPRQEEPLYLLPVGWPAQGGREKAG